LISWPAGRVWYEELDSTNSEARRLAEKGEPGPLWISTAHQTAGRGRRGRVWDAGQGNLAATLLIRPDVPQAAIGQLSFVAALAVAETASHFAPTAAISVKWPNDVLAEGKKLAGLLLEGGPGWLAIGIGINLATFPEGTEFPSISLAQLGIAPPSAEQALTVLAARFAHWYDAWMKDGFDTIRDAWLARAAGLGGPIRARLPNETREGMFEGIDHTGALLLNEQGRLRAIAAAEVFF
jgi:BirA family biotin operon repressor/biotin-[acetyl-CoA-carboxylase] ligase